ncbi:M23 family metallopeptidase [Flavilitoribacter nigricans]|uniref:M23ase beta-sheet core domain-containing protein n=1 Tax=Flavilitoribacter nigricans (strain ATCC 23147 / DSM 23189 / NBRC 102662 / NCIMB 1420 / SS-2) TaxID=1122177 RepID=A0A2D0N5P2_FLAN2|nr:M23 family metallopeptidase [Flavilitoribacter nigricans]PHN03093.1 hypothetical protein CRP01_28860 [Flavilitoribacter nigricans DSM 23189 = NBRC 102662]
MSRIAATISFLAILFAGSFYSFTGEYTDPYPTDYFAPPVKGVLRLSGTFGELRSNHFHSGIDIKGGIGVPLYTVADGYISRIKIEGGGYGNALYITHPNGYTSVYAHMNEYIPEIETFVKSQQYANESFDLDLELERDQFPLKKGDKIGEMGTTGYSFGPHLHFEMRNTQTGAPINPLLFGYKVADDQSPRMHQLKVYGLNEQLETIDSEIHSLVSKHGGYGVRGDTLVVDTRQAGFGLKVYDHMTGVNNWNGIYKLDVKLEDSLIYQFEMETFPFNETRYLNAHLDYAEQVQNKAYFNRCYRLPGNRLSIYREQPEEGVVRLSSKRAKKVEMIASDLAGNQSYFVFWIKQRPGNDLEEESLPYNYFLPFNQESVIDNGSIRVHIPRGALYENCYLQYQLVTDRSDNVYSSVHKLHNDLFPIHEYFELAIRPVVLPESLRDKAFVALCGNNIVNCGGQWENGMLTTRVRTFGDFCIMVDEVPPTIRPVNFSSNLKGADRIDFSIWDNFRTGGTAAGLKFRATVDGRWVLMKYDAKNARITHYFDDTIPPGQHEFRLTLTDAVGNETVFERSFTR